MLTHHHFFFLGDYYKYYYFPIGRLPTFSSLLLLPSDLTYEGRKRRGRMRVVLVVRSTFLTFPFSVTNKVIHTELLRIRQLIIVRELSSVESSRVIEVIQEYFRVKGERRAVGKMILSPFIIILCAMRSRPIRCNWSLIEDDFTMARPDQLNRFRTANTSSTTQRRKEDE